MPQLTELLPVISGLIIGLLAAPAGKRRLFAFILCLPAGLAVHRLSGESLPWLAADVLSTLVFALTSCALFRKVRRISA